MRTRRESREAGKTRTVLVRELGASIVVVDIESRAHDVPQRTKGISEQLIGIVKVPPVRKVVVVVEQNFPQRSCFFRDQGTLEVLEIVIRLVLQVS